MADTRNSAEFAFTHFDASPSGWPAAWAWFVGLLQGAYVLTGYGMVASLCEELPINFVLPDIQPLLEVASLQPMPLLYKTVTKSSGAALGLTFLSTSLSTMLTGLG